MAATNVAALAIAGVIALGFVALVYRAGRRIKHADAQVERILTETLPTPARPVRDTVPGINLADQDACELIWSMPAFAKAATAIDEGLTDLFEQLGPPPARDPQLDAGCDRLWDAIRDQQQKGETS